MSTPQETADTSTDDTATPATGTEEPKKGRRPLKRSTKIALAVIVVLAVLAAIGFTVSYFLDASRFVSTDNAQVDGTQIPIVAPASGTLTGWDVAVGSVVRKDQVLGRVELQGAYVQPQLPIRAPADSTVATTNTAEGAYLTAGTQLAIAYDPSDVYVTARVDETDIDDVQVGRPVDFAVDAYPGRTFRGYVDQIQGGAAAVFSPFPQSNSGGNFQKVTQVIPVRVGITDMQGADLIPGMNVTVDIHKPGE
ncbi:efflux RND transporter periplasmic adaptor subunit [Actinomycetospora sp. OC33-EN08]|uniref:Efflux RND transporter periplasmic adaptor subunit n=1 Tax=Actinomycetospora aurantiaca TaxID=3129233 RepID=A0ABU8MVK3_9PSEU